MKKTIAFLLAVITAISFAGCNNGESSNGESKKPTYSSIKIGEESPIPYERRTDGPKIEEAKYTEDADMDRNFSIKLEAEKSDTKLPIAKEIAGFDGDGYAGPLASKEDTVSWKITIPSDGAYNIMVHYYSENKDTSGLIKINDKSIARNKYAEVKQWANVSLLNTVLSKGETVLSLGGSDKGNLYIDYVEVSIVEQISNDVYDVPATLTNPNATDNTKRLMKFIADNYGKNVLTGQTSDKMMGSAEFRAIYELTGRYPAIAAFDMMEYSPSRVARKSRSQSVSNAVQWYNKENGIVTFAWHWNAPTKYLYSDEVAASDAEKNWWSGFYAKATTIDLAKIMNGEDQEGYDLLVSDIDAIAEKLKLLQDEGVPVLWRPLHEASGGWFWWGASGPDAYIKLWQLMYDRMTNHHKLNNLIWVYNGQHKDWYPGDEYVDIISEDIYPAKKDVSPQAERFKDALSATSTKKIIALSENGVIPDIDQMLRDNVMWSWFAVWGGEFIVKGQNLSTEYTPEDIIIKAYNHERTITLDELPDLKTYPLD